MSDLNINFDKRDIRALIAFFFKKGYSAEKCADEINSTLGEKTISLSTVFEWFKEFRFGRTSLEDAPRSGRPREVAQDENVSAIKDLVKADPHITIRQIAEELNISTYSAHNIMRNLLNLRKLSVQWVPHLLTSEQMDIRVKMYRQNLKRMRDGRQQIISKILTGD
jgi:transposase